LKKFLLIVAIVAAIAVAIAFYLRATTPATGAGVRVPLTSDQREMLASVPASADTVALIPTAAVVRRKLFANPVTRPQVLEFAEQHQLPRAWMIGDADLVVWRTGKETSYSVRLDPFRAAVVRFYLMFASSVDAQVSSGRFLINAGSSEPLGTQRLDEVLASASGLGPADALIIEQSSSRGDFPPIGRPAVTAVNLGADDVTLTSVAPLPSAASAAGGGGATRPKFPRNALLTGVFHERPRIVGDLDRLFIARVSRLLDAGGSVVLYDVNAGTLLPRPDCLMIASATPDNLKTVRDIESTVQMFGDIRQSGDQVLVSFDKDSMQKYSSETFLDAQWPTNDWAVRLDPKRAVPILDKLSGNTGLRIAAPRIFRAARNLDDWIGYLQSASSVEVSHSWAGEREELRVRIASK